MELEDVQRSFTRLVEGIGLLPYKADYIARKTNER